PQHLLRRPALEGPAARDLPGAPDRKRDADQVRGQRDEDAAQPASQRPARAPRRHRARSRPGVPPRPPRHTDPQRLRSLPAARPAAARPAPRAAAQPPQAQPDRDDRRADEPARRALPRPGDEPRVRLPRAPAAHDHGHERVPGRGQVDDGRQPRRDDRPHRQARRARRPRPSPALRARALPRAAGARPDDDGTRPLDARRRPRLGPGRRRRRHHVARRLGHDRRREPPAGALLRPHAAEPRRVHPLARRRPADHAPERGLRHRHRRRRSAARPRRLAGADSPRRCRRPRRAARAAPPADARRAAPRARGLGRERARHRRHRRAARGRRRSLRGLRLRIRLRPVEERARRGPGRGQRDPRGLMSSIGQSIGVSAAYATSTSRPRGWLIRRALLAADVIGLVLAFAVTENIFGGITKGQSFSTRAEVGLFLLTLPVWILLAKLYGLYDRDESRTDHRTVDDLAGVFHLTTVGTWVVIAGARVTNFAHPYLVRVTVFWALAIASIVVTRTIARRICRQHSSYLQNTLVVGTGREARLIAKRLEQQPEFGLRVLGFVDSGTGPTAGGVEQLPMRGTLDDLPWLVRSKDVDRVIMGF